jgi:hypothetical protein
MFSSQGRAYPDLAAMGHNVSSPSLSPLFFCLKSFSFQYPIVKRTLYDSFEALSVCFFPS